MLKAIIKSLVENRGTECLENVQTINILSDCQAFADCIPAKFVLKTVIQEGFATKLIKIEAQGIFTKAIAEKIVDDLYSKYGIRRDISTIVINALLYALNLPEIQDESVVEAAKNLMSSNNPKDEHIIFSGISLRHSMKEIANHLSNRGFQTVRVKPYQIKMSGTFCDIDDVELFINGSPLGVTKNIYLQVNSSPTSLYVGWSNKLYDLIHSKYGSPYKSIDTLDTIGNDFDHFTHHILKYSEMVENYLEILDCEWSVKGGTIELNWMGRKIALTYKDSLNTEQAEIHQEKFNADSI